jgi:hypothetical protein
MKQLKKTGTSIRRPLFDGISDPSWSSFCRKILQRSKEKCNLRPAPLLRCNHFMETYDVGIVLGHFYTGLSITSRQKKRMQKSLELLTTARITYVMTTGGKGMWKKSAPSRPINWISLFLIISVASGLLLISSGILQEISNDA